MDRIAVNGTLIEIDGDEMAHTMWTSVKGSTITPDADRVKEYGPQQLLPSPNGTLRKASNGVLFREPVMLDAVARVNKHV